MMGADIVHPTDQILRSYGLGKLDDASAESVSEHLESCALCQGRVAEVSPDSFLGRLRGRKGGRRRQLRAGRIHRSRRPIMDRRWSQHRRREKQCRRVLPTIPTTRSSRSWGEGGWGWSIWLRTV